MQKVLIVEDDMFLRDIYRESLESESFQVGEALDGEDALQKIKSQDWDLILLDVVMPKVSGIEVVKDLQKDTTKKRNIVFLTNSHDVEDQNQIKELGYESLLKSEITPEDLISFVRKHLQKVSA